MLSRSVWKSVVVAGLCSVAPVAWAEDEEKSPASVFANLDKNSDGVVTADEIADDKKRFFEHLLRQGDKDKNGKLTQAEFEAALKQDEAKPDGGAVVGGGNRPQFDFNPEEMFRRADQNKDGKLTKDEIPDRGRPLFEGLFQRLGKDEISQEEFFDAVKRMRDAAGTRRPAAFSADEAEQNFKRLDSNSDGILKKDEIPERMRPLFGRVFERLGKEELTKDEFVEAAKRAANLRPDQRPGQGEGAGPEQIFSRLDANKDGRVEVKEVPEEQRERFLALLKAADKKDSDSLTKEEFIAAAGKGERRPERPGQPNRPQPGERGAEAEQLFKRWDTNGDGKVTLDEVPDMAKRFVGQLLERAGKGRDGSLTLEDLKSLREMRPDGARPGAGRPGAEGRPGDAPRGRGGLFQKLDADGDGKLSKDEVGKLSELFEQLDRNKDGSLDAEEIGGGPGDGAGRPRGRPEGAK